MPASVRLPAVLDRLREKYGQPASPPVTDLFEQVLLTQVAYLAKDKKRLAAFEALRDRVGLSPEAILAADPEELEEIARLGGGVAVEERAERMRASARLVQDAWGGSLSKVLDLPTDEARKALETFAMVGRPGAEVMLSIAGAYPDLALDSNGLRVLVRLGYGDEQKSYDRTHRSVVDDVRDGPGVGTVDMLEAHLLLKEHGRRTCKNTTPRCDDCPLTAECAYYHTVQPG